LRKLGAIGLVLVGLIILAGIPPLLVQAPFLLAQAFEQELPVRTVYAWFLPAILIGFALGAGLIVFRRTLARRLFGDDPAGVAIDAPDLLRSGVVLLGLWSVTNALTALGTGIASAISYLDPVYADSAGMFLVSAMLRPLAYPVLDLVIGIALIVWSGPLAARLWDLKPPKRAKRVEPAKPVLPCACPHCGHPYDPSDYAEGTKRLCSECRGELDGCA